MMLAAAFAGIGFGNAGVHLPHGMSYPVSGMVRSFVPAGLSSRSPDRPARHVGHPQRPGRLPLHRPGQPGAPPRSRPPAGRGDDRRRRREDAGEILAGAIIDVMRKTGMPNGLSAVGYTEADIDALVAGTLPQHRVTKLSPRPAGEAELRALFLDSMTCW